MNDSLQDSFQQELIKIQRDLNADVLSRMEAQMQKIDSLQAALNAKLIADAELKAGLVTTNLRITKLEELEQKFEGRLLSTDDVRDFKRSKSFVVAVFAIVVIFQTLQAVPFLLKLFATP